MPRTLLRYVAILAAETPVLRPRFLLLFPSRRAFSRYQIARAASRRHRSRPRMHRTTVTTARGFSTHRGSSRRPQAGERYLHAAIPSIYPQCTTWARIHRVYRNTKYVITITNYLATTASHFTQINKGYPLDKDGGRAGVTLRARGGECTAHAARSTGSRTAEARNTRNAVAARLPSTNPDAASHPTAHRRARTPRALASHRVPSVCVTYCRSLARARAHVDTCNCTYARHETIVC